MKYNGVKKTEGGGRAISGAEMIELMTDLMCYIEKKRNLV